MTDANTNNPFDVSPTSEPGEEATEPQRRFEANPPTGDKRSKKRSSFSPSFTPRAGSFASSRSERPPSKSVAEPEPKPKPSPPPAVKQEVVASIDPVFERQRLILLLVVMIPLGLFAFWPAWEMMAKQWYYNLDYGHGFFVIPLIGLFLYLRLETYPGTQRRLAWIGLSLVVFSCGMRLYAASQSFDAIEQWAILFWVLGIVWSFYGTRVFYWASPSLLFMVFMFPLPYRFEVILRHRLQEFAAQFASQLLVLLGEPAVPIRNTIRMSTLELDVAGACSGIRFLVSIMAIAFAAILLMRRPWWQNLCVFMLAPPLALFVNAARIAMTGILLEHYSEVVQWFVPHTKNIGVAADEFSGIVMIFIAFGMFFATIWFIGKVFQRVEI